ncbi:MAG TPA: hypothetical protein VFO10_06455 [Oligoflexus sp.]|uniref:hypothetical protein n=1 Tax=Oligoflexus sp. TaxID=1971216 RepID=UPI002D8005DB|nr:hypothetical protein [Oligoflexus sp.]HET9236872.1 hypothetical protein [Oligoflexus sp.]
MKDHLGFYKSWASSFPIGQIIYKVTEPYTVESVGTDFLVLKSSKDGSVVRIFRNTEESYEFTASPQVS